MSGETPKGIVETMARAIEDARFPQCVGFDYPTVGKASERYAKSAIAALSAAGYVIVPVEPTEAMCDAGAPEVASFDSRYSQGHDYARDCWEAMIRAANKEGL